MSAVISASAVILRPRAPLYVGVVVKPVGTRFRTGRLIGRQLPRHPVRYVQVGIERHRHTLVVDNLLLQSRCRPDVCEIVELLTPLAPLMLTQHIARAGKQSRYNQQQQHRLVQRLPAHATRRLPRHICRFPFAFHHILQYFSHRFGPCVIGRTVSAPFKSHIYRRDGTRKHV